MEVAGKVKKCKHCKQEIDAKATKCQYCHSDQRSWFGRHKIITAFLIFCLIDIIGIPLIVVGSNQSNTGKSTPMSSDNTAPASSSGSAAATSDKSSAAGSSQSQAAKAAPAPQVLLDLSGKGTKTTQKFTAGGDWDLNWSYDCTANGGSGNFIVQIMNGDGSLSTDNQMVNQLGSKDSGVEHYHTGGTFYLQIQSENCTWSVQAKG